MMVRDPEKRISIDEILLHPCIKRAFSSNRHSSSSGAIAKSTSFGSQLAQVPLEQQQHRRGVILISPATVAQET